MSRESTPGKAFQQLAERSQFIASAMLIVFLLGWFLWFYPYDDLLDRSDTPLGADYSMFYVAGRVALSGDIDRLYDQAEHQRRLQALFPKMDPEACLPYRYPPLVAFLMAPLAALPYAASFTVFLALSCAAWWGAMWLLGRELTILQGSWRKAILWTAVGWPVLLETWIGGQASTFALLILAGSIVCLRREWLLGAGACLALAAFKPNVLLLFAFGCALARPRILKGAVPVLCVLFLLSVAAVGWSGLGDYLSLTLHLTASSWDVETPYWKIHSLTTWLALLAPGKERLLSLLIGLFAVTAVHWKWRRLDSADTATDLIAVALLISLNALLNPYTPIYDLTLLAAGGLLTAEYLRTSGDARERDSVWAEQLILATVYFGPHLSQTVSKSTGLQPFALALLILASWQSWLFLERVRSTSATASPSRPDRNIDLTPSSDST